MGSEMCIRDRPRGGLPLQPRGRCSSWFPIGRHKPPWPNGQAVGPLIRRLRVRVPQGVCSPSQCLQAVGAFLGVPSFALWHGAFFQGLGIRRQETVCPRGQKASSPARVTAARHRDLRALAIRALLETTTESVNSSRKAAIALRPCYLPQAGGVSAPKSQPPLSPIREPIGNLAYKVCWPNG